MPASITLLSDYFPPETRTTATSISNGGMYLGSALSSFSIIAIATQGWRYTFKAMGISGIVIGALMLLFMAEPRNIKPKEPSQNNFNTQ